MRMCMYQDDLVKLQALTLAAKLYVAGLERADVLLPYVLSLARYDLSYDVRDRVCAERVCVCVCV
jgi:hypothetical protein